MLHTGAKAVPSRSGLLTTVACGPRGEAAYALEGSVFVAGAAIQWLRDGMELLDAAADSEFVARSVPDAGGTFLVPAFTGLGAPYWRADARGVWCGITRGTTRAHLVRAALESIAFQTKDVVDAMNSDAGARLKRLRVDGGATQNDFLMQFQADILGVPIERPSVVESTALGAAYLAGIGAGMWIDRGAIPPDETETVFTPRMARKDRDAACAGWRAAVDLLLNRLSRRLRLEPVEHRSDDLAAAHFVQHLVEEPRVEAKRDEALGRRLLPRLRCREDRRWDRPAREGAAWASGAPSRGVGATRASPEIRGRGAR